MAKDFTYFAGTLPMLFFGEKPALSLAAFDEDARRLTGDATADLLQKVSLFREDAADMPKAVRKFYDWENALRNTLLDMRKKFRSDAADYKRNNPDFYSEIAPALAQIAAMSDLMEAEKAIDTLRWKTLDDFSVGHYTDFTALAFYRIKLLILEKYVPRTAEAGNQALEKILSGLMSANTTN